MCLEYSLLVHCILEHSYWQCQQAASIKKTWTQKHKMYLSATKTPSARSVAVLNTFLKNKAATATPEDPISACQRVDFLRKQI